MYQQIYNLAKMFVSRNPSDSQKGNPRVRRINDIPYRCHCLIGRSVKHSHPLNRIVPKNTEGYRDVNLILFNLNGPTGQFRYAGPTCHRVGDSECHWLAKTEECSQ